MKIVLLNLSLNRYNPSMELKHLTTNPNPESFLEHLTQRGLVHDETPTLKAYLKSCNETGEVPKIYAGFDPSSDSLQVGNLLAILLLRRAQLHGVQPYVLLGGATGLIGDPSGKKEERTILDKDVASQNITKIRAQLEKFVDFTPGRTQAKIVNNFDWFKDIHFLDFLRDVGKYITVNYMIAKDSVKLRMETGISYAEFGYMLVQGYDFLHLFEKESCKIQVGGSDQWGNMTTGLELIRKKHGKEAYAISSPLLTDAAGNKFGKSEGGAIYLDAGKTTPYKFYQFWLNQPDSEIPKLLRMMTLLSDASIEETDRGSQAAPERRIGQRVLCQELTTLVHGNKTMLAVEAASRVLFSKDKAALAELDDHSLEMLSREVPSAHLGAKELELSILDLLVNSNLCASKGEAKRHLKSGAVTMNREKVTDENFKMSMSHLQRGKFALLGIGKANLHLLLLKH